MALSMAPSRMYVFSVDPTVTDDVTKGYEVGNWWLNDITNRLFQALDVTEGAAVWEHKPSKGGNTFIPTIEFGGASTGITYSAQEGNLITIDNAILFTAFISLSSKGTATGEARVIGLPTANGSNNFAFNFEAHRMINSVNYTNFGARIAPTESEIRLFEQGDNQPLSALDDTNFNSNSQLFVSGFYFA